MSARVSVSAGEKPKPKATFKFLRRDEGRLSYASAGGPESPLKGSSMMDDNNATVPGRRDSKSLREAIAHDMRNAKSHDPLGEVVIAVPRKAPPPAARAASAGPGGGEDRRRPAARPSTNHRPEWVDVEVPPPPPPPAGAQQQQQRPDHGPDGRPSPRPANLSRRDSEEDSFQRGNGRRDGDDERVGARYDSAIPPRRTASAPRRYPESADYDDYSPPPPQRNYFRRPPPRDYSAPAGGRSREEDDMMLQLEREIQAAQEERSRYNYAKQQLDREKQRFDNYKYTMQQQLDDERAELDNLRSRADRDAEKGLKGMEERYKNVSSLLATEREASRKLTQENDSLRAQLEELTTTLRETTKAHKAEVTRMQRDIDSLTRRNSELLAMTKESQLAVLERVAGGATPTVTSTAAPPAIQSKVASPAPNTAYAAPAYAATTSPPHLTETMPASSTPRSVPPQRGASREAPAQPAQRPPVTTSASSGSFLSHSTGGAENGHPPQLSYVAPQTQPRSTSAGAEDSHVSADAAETSTGPASGTPRSGAAPAHTQVVLDFTPRGNSSEEAAKEKRAREVEERMRREEEAMQQRRLQRERETAERRKKEEEEAEEEAAAAAAAAAAADAAKKREALAAASRKRKEEADEKAAAAAAAASATSESVPPRTSTVQFPPEDATKERKSSGHPVRTPRVTTAASKSTPGEGKATASAAAAATTAPANESSAIAKKRVAAARPPAAPASRRIPTKDELIGNSEPAPAESFPDDEVVSETALGDNPNKREVLYRSGKREIHYANGTVKVILPAGHTILHFTNGDVKCNFPSGKSTYWYDAAQTTHTQNPDGVQVFEFLATGQTERHMPDGTKEILYPDGIFKLVHADGTDETFFPDEAPEA